MMIKISPFCGLESGYSKTLYSLLGGWGILYALYVCGSGSRKVADDPTLFFGGVGLKK